MGRPANTIEKVLARLEPADLGYESLCMVWPGVKTRGGYGRVRWSMRDVLVHRIVFLELVGPLDDGAVPDHLCHTYTDCDLGDFCPHRACANPDHLEAVTSEENWKRSQAPSALNALKDECLEGHPFVGTNLIVEVGPRGKAIRRCRICRNRRSAGYERVKRAAQRALD